MDVAELEILAASVVLLYEDHLKSNGAIRSATSLAKGMRLLRDAVSPETMELCVEFKNQEPLKA